MSNNELKSEHELNTPVWLNEQFFENVLTKVEGKHAKVLDLLLKSAAPKTEHYASVLFRAKVKYILESQPAEEKMQTFILKVELFEDGYNKEVMGYLHLFQTEIRMYAEVIPKIEKVLRQYGDDTVLGPKLLDYSDTSPAYVIFEDLAEKGYTTIGHRFTNLDEVKAALLKLAKLHAISYKLSKENDESFAAFDKGSMNSINLENLDFTKNATKLLKEVLNEHDDLSKFVPLIDSVENILVPKTIDMFNEIRDGKCNGLVVLNHGDLHSKNIMIQNVEGKLKDLMLIDYQVSIFGTPAIDLHYAFTLLFSPEMRRDHHDELLYYYITNFQETLRKTEYHGHIPTITEFRFELQKHRYCRLFLTLSFLVCNYAFADENGSMSEIIENKDEQRKQLQNPRFLDELRELLPKLLFEGSFEY